MASRSPLLVLLSLVLLSFFGSGAAAAQAFPSKPIKLICPWPAGGSTDAVIRALRSSWGIDLQLAGHHNMQAHFATSRAI